MGDCRTMALQRTCRSRAGVSHGRCQPLPTAGFLERSCTASMSAAFMRSSSSDCYTTCSLISPPYCDCE